MSGKIRIVYTDEFQHDVRKIRDRIVHDRIKKLIMRLIENPYVGKPLQYHLSGLRSLRIPPFRLVYEYNERERTLTLLKFEHREISYK